MNSRSTNHLNRLGLVTAVAATFCFGVSSVQAQSLSQTVWTTTPISDGTLTDWASSLSFPMFNVPGMRLTSATFTLTENLATTFNLTSSANGVAKGSIDLTSNLTLTDPAFAGSPIQADTAISLKTGILTKGQSISISGANSATTSVTITDPLQLKSWTGFGSFAVNLYTDSNFSVTVLGGNNKWSLNTTAGATGYVTYEYKPGPAVPNGPPPSGIVPEPTRYGTAFALGLLGLAVARRIRR